MSKGHQTTLDGVQGGAAVKRGLANMESALGDAPMLKFKSDNAFRTEAEAAQRTAAQEELKDALARQIEEKRARKAAEAAEEKARDAAELVRPRST